MTRARTIKQGLALAAGKMNYKNSTGCDLKHIARRNQIERNLPADSQMCWSCEQGFGRDLDVCPHCQTPVVPF